MTPIVPVPLDDVAALIFDLDGTLVDTREVNRNALRTIFARHGVQQLPKAPEGTGFVDWCALLISHGLLPADISVPQLQADCEREVARTLSQVREVPAVANLARWAKGRLATAIATGSARSSVDPLLAATGLADLFDVIVTRDEVEHGKPAPDLFLRAAELLSASPGRCVVLEDTQIGLDAAKNAGMTAVDVRPYRAEP